MGKESAGSGTEAEAMGRLGRLQERVEVGRGLRESPGGQHQVAQNLDDHRGILNGGEDGPGSAALRTGCEVDGEDTFAASRIRSHARENRLYK